MPQPEVTTYLDTVQIPDWLKAQVITCYHEYYPPNTFEGRDPKDWFERATDKPVRFLIVQGKTMISHAAVITRTVEVDGVPFKVAGLGGVLTEKNHRGQGYGRHVVRAAMDFMDGKDDDLGALFCLPNNQRFYENLGWEVLHNPHILVGKDKETAHPHTNDELFMIRYLSPKSKQQRSLIENAPIFWGEEW